MMKRKKPSSPTHDAAVRPPKKTTKDSFYAEEEISQVADPQECVTKYKKCCSKLRKLAKEIYEAKLSTKKTCDPAECMMPVLQMKELNRSAQFCLKRIREMTQEKKTQIDQHHLKRQNLMYEVIHLQKEISRCLEFRSKHEDINLIPVEQFYAEAPVEISKPETTKTDLHAQTLARLTWDLEQRKELSNELKSADESVEVVRKQIQAKKDYLNGLLPRLKEIMETTKPVQEYMDISFSKEMEQNSMASLLPSALYTLFIEVKAYSQARDSSVSVNVEGDFEEARAVRPQLLELRLAPGRLGTSALADQSGFEFGDGSLHASRQDSDASDEDESTPSGGAVGDGGGGSGQTADKRSSSPGSRKEKSRRRRRGTKSARSAEEEALNGLLRLHPLCVIVNVNLKGGVVLRVAFNYAMTLRVVTVTVKLDLPVRWEDDFDDTNELLQPQSLLAYLYPGDSGHASGLHVLRHEMQKAGVTSLWDHVSRLGIPFVWAQRLAGLDLLPTFHDQTGLTTSKGEDYRGVHSSIDISEIPSPNIDIAFDHSVECFSKIKRRVTARLALIRELAAIDRNEWRLTDSQQKLVPLRQFCRLRAWRKIAFEDIEKLPQAQKFITGDLAHTYDFFYTGILERESAPRVRATVHVIIPVDYPAATPICLLTVPSPIPGAPELTNANCLQIQELETTVNCYLSEFALDREWTPGNGLLACQLQRLHSCFDVFVESGWMNLSDGANQLDRRSVKNIRIFRASKFPSRRMPYKYSDAFDTFIQR